MGVQGPPLTFHGWRGAGLWKASLWGGAGRPKPASCSGEAVAEPRWQGTSRVEPWGAQGWQRAVPVQARCCLARLGPAWFLEFWGTSAGLCSLWPRPSSRRAGSAPWCHLVSVHEPHVRRGAGGAGQVPLDQRWGPDRSAEGQRDKQTPDTVIGRPGLEVSVKCSFMS